jgi:alpha-glucosidase (family GH31 glycosyl hydrolase)
MAQASALFPMMQFSWAPWRVLSPAANKIVADAAALHREMSEEIIALVNDAEKTGEPILRNLEYVFPHKGYAAITDEFMLGKDVLVCPVITKGTRSKTVIFPEGTWQGSDSKIYKGASSQEINTPLDSLVWFRKI